MNLPLLENTTQMISRQPADIAAMADETQVKDA